MISAMARITATITMNLICSLPFALILPFVPDDAILDNLQISVSCSQIQKTCRRQSSSGLQQKPDRSDPSDAVCLMAPARCAKNFRRQAFCILCLEKWMLPGILSGSIQHLFLMDYLMPAASRSSWDTTPAAQSAFALSSKEKSEATFMNAS